MAFEGLKLAHQRHRRATKLKTSRAAFYQDELNRRTRREQTRLIKFVVALALTAEVEESMLWYVYITCVFSLHIFSCIQNAERFSIDA